MIVPTPAEQSRRNEVIEAVLEATRSAKTIKLPPYDPDHSVGADVAYQTIGIEPNPFGGTVGPFRYQFEGEEDLLHLIVSRSDLKALSPEEGQEVCGYLLPDVSKALVWFKPGEVTQHFYVGHDDLLKS
jgi:hypothetical protein